MVCHQCGSPVSSDQASCPNCGATLQRKAKKLEISKGAGLQRYTQKLRAVTAEDRRLLPAGEIIQGRFELKEMIGRGPLGQVFEARDTDLDVGVAIKVLPAEVFRHKKDRKRFERAVKKARQMTQRNVVRVHAHGFHEDMGWVSMQHLEGLALSKLLRLRASKDEMFELAEVARLVDQVTDALEAIHDAYLHGDLKPSNIIFLPDVLKVTDHFLVAGLPGRAIASRLEESAFLAPELRVARHEDDPSALSDVYSLGAIVSKMMFGSTLPPDEYDDAIADDPIKIAVAKVCERALAEDPAGRFASITEFAEAFYAAAETGDVEAEPIAGVEQALMPPPAPKDPPAPPPAPQDADTDDEEVSDDDVLSVEEDEEVSDEEARALMDQAILDDLPEEEIATIEVRRRGDGKPPELGDLLPTNEVDRGKIKGPKAPELGERESTATAVAPKPESKGKEDDDGGGVPIWAVIVALVAVAVIVAIGVQSSKKEEKVVTIDDGDAVATTEEDGSTEAADNGDPAVATSACSPKEDADGAPEVVAALGAARSERDGALASASDAAQQVAEAAEATADMDGVAAQPDMSAAVASATPTPPTSPKTAGAKKPTTPDARQGAPAKASGSKSAARPDSQPGSGTDCPQGMVLVRNRKAGNVCIDRYEYPGRGATPKTRVSWFDAKNMCEAKGKRLCSRAEWSRACGGKYPWGRNWNADKCNTVDVDDFERTLAAAGSTKTCRSRSGAYDMVGNVFEWTAEKRIVGGSFNSGEDVASCRYSSGKSPSSKAGDIGFRCCAEPQ